MDGPERASAVAAAALALALALPAGIGGQAPPMPTPHRLGVVSFYGPRLMYVKYQPLVDYLSARTGHPWELSVNTSYESTVADVCAGRVSLAYLGPFSYLRAHARCAAEPVVKLNTGDRAAFYADVLVRADSSFQRLEDLAGHRIGFGDALSTSSHLVPRAMFLAAGLEPGRDFGCRYFKQHERAARAVLMGEVEACGVRDFIAEAFVHRGLRRVARSEPIPAYPLVVPPGLPAELRRTLTEALRGFPGGFEPLRGGEGWDPELVDGFAAATDPDYDPVRRLSERVFGPGSLLRPGEELRCR